MILFNGMHVLLLMLTSGLTYIIVKPKGLQISASDKPKIQKINWIEL